MTKNPLKHHLYTALLAAVALLPNGLRADTCYIDGSVTYQTMDGIGFSSAWCGQLSSVKNAALYDTLGFSLLRIRIDQNNSWSDETANAAAAHARSLKVLGCPWYIPDAYRSGSTLPSSQYGNYCKWLSSAAGSIKLDYVSLKNEPDGSTTDGTLTGTQLHDLLAAGVIIGCPIALADAINYNDSLTDPTLNDANTANRVTIVSGHIYGGGNYEHTNALNKGKRTWMTEHYIANSRDSMPNCVVLGQEIVDCMHNWMSAYFFWWVNDSDTSVNLVDQSGTIYKAGYAGGQFAKWIRPGKVRISTTHNPSTNVSTVAFRNGGIVVIAVNTGTSAVVQPFNFANISGLTSMNVTRTSSTENMTNVGTVSLVNNGFTYTLPPQSITTFHQY